MGGVWESNEKTAIEGWKSSNTDYVAAEKKKKTGKIVIWSFKRQEMYLLNFGI